jgi:hypothetical protein
VINTSSPICANHRVHPAHGIYVTTSRTPVPDSEVGAVVDTMRLVGQCKGLDFDTWFERTQDAAL